jgi:hypothetical protein
LEPEVARAFSARLGEVVKSVLGAEVLLDPVLTSFPSMDPVSNNAASQSARMINDARTYLETWRRQLWEARTALDAQLAAYEDVERRNVGRT